MAICVVENVNRPDFGNDRPFSPMDVASSVYPLPDIHGLLLQGCYAAHGLSISYVKGLANDFRGTTPYKHSNSTACRRTAGSLRSPSHETYINRSRRE